MVVESTGREKRVQDGELRLATLPGWKREGYADVVAGETSVGSDADEVLIRGWDPHARVLAEL